MEKEIVIKIEEETYNRIMGGWMPLHKAVNLMENVQKGIPLPKGHGRLIDADSLEYTCNADECGMLTGCNHCQYHIVTEHELDNAPTIIEGSDSE